MGDINDQSLHDPLTNLRMIRLKSGMLISAHF